LTTQAAAKAWRVDAAKQSKDGHRVEPTKTTLREAAEAFLMGAEAGTILSRYRTPYKPSVLRCYRRDLERYVLPDLGTYSLGDLRRPHFQRLADRLQAQGLSGQKVRNVLVPVQAIYRRAVRDEEVSVSPVVGLDLPGGSEPRDRSVAPEEADALIAALPDDGLRALYATAHLSGLRRGELRALRVEAIDFDAGVIHVTASWDDQAGEVPPKSKSGIRRVPIGGELRRVLSEHLLATGRRGRDFVFGSKADQPFAPSAVRRRAHTAWNAVNAKERERALREGGCRTCSILSACTSSATDTSRGCSTPGSRSSGSATTVGTTART
jgi:integrase